MSETELKKLKDLSTPVPSARAKAAALDAARVAFTAQHSQNLSHNNAGNYDTGNDNTDKDYKANQNNGAENNRANKIVDIASKGNSAGLRHSFKTSKPKGLKLMHILSRPTTSAIAASLLVAAISIPALMYYLPESSFKTPSYRDDGFFTRRPAQDKGTVQNRGAIKEAARTTPRLASKLSPAKPNTELSALHSELKRKDGAISVRKEMVAPDLSPAPAIDGLVLGLGKGADAKAKRVFSPAAPLPQGYTSNGVIIAQDQLAGLPTIMIPSQLDDQKPAVNSPHLNGRDKFEVAKPNPIKSVLKAPVSTFSIDVDTASYAFVRRALNAGRLPQKSAVRVEELINYFSYDYAPPENRDMPFRPIVSVLPSPWSAQNKLVHIAIKGYQLKAAERPRANLVFLIDVSGSMQGADRLPLLKNAFRLLVDNLKPDDTIGIVTYASGSGIVLPATKIADRGKILAAINALGAGGSTAGAKGIRDAYALAAANFDKAAVNRIILGTDGDFNVGISDRNELKSYIERKRKSGIFLSILGVGQGNYNDALMQTLAQNGNGTAAYIDTLSEARKVLVEEASANLFPIARDVKIQIEFNPARVKSYRLIGYETRALKREDFNNDKVDAGDVGSGHNVTAIYEITPVGAKDKTVDARRYGKRAAVPASNDNSNRLNAEFGFLKLRYKLPHDTKSRLIKLPITQAQAQPSLSAASNDVRFSTAVAAFGQLLRGGTHLGTFNYDNVIALASGARGDDPFGLRAQFVNLVRLAKSARP